MSSYPVAAPAAELRPRARFELLAGGPTAYARIFERIATARRSIVVRAFEWRDDQTGRDLAAALLAAADRGVAVTIIKDHVGAYYEYLEATKQSLFHKDIELIPRLGTLGMMAFYGRWGSLRQTPSPVGRRPARPPARAPGHREALRPLEALRLRRRDGDPGRDGHRRRLPPRERRLHGRSLGRRRGRTGWPIDTRGAPASTRPGRSTTCCTRCAAAR